LSEGRFEGSSERKEGLGIRHPSALSPNKNSLMRLKNRMINKMLIIINFSSQDRIRTCNNQLTLKDIICFTIQPPNLPFNDKKRTWRWQPGSRMFLKQ